MEENKPQPNAQRSDEQPPQDEKSFANKPTILADNGSRTKVKLWNNNGKNGEFQTCAAQELHKHGKSRTYQHRDLG